MIVTFGDKATERLALGERVAKFAFIERAAQRRLEQLHIAGSLEDLRLPPGNRLEKLSGNLSGHYSIRVNEQWRIVFRWTDSGPEAVQLVDYH